MYFNTGWMCSRIQSKYYGSGWREKKQASTPRLQGFAGGEEVMNFAENCTTTTRITFRIERPLINRDNLFTLPFFLPVRAL